MITNLFYIIYFLIKSNYGDLISSFKCTYSKGYNPFVIVFDILLSSLRYGSSFVDYFNFGFYKKKNTERAKYATMGMMYQFHKKMNNSKYINKVDDKLNFAKYFHKFTLPVYFFNKNEYYEIKNTLLNLSTNKIVLKNPIATAGMGIRFINFSILDEEIIIDGKSLEEFLSIFFKMSEIFYFEPYLKQHTLINEISSTAVNTIRMITLIEDSKNIKIIGSIFRISVNCPIDNFSAGNIAAEIDERTGIVITGGIKKRSACDTYHEFHLITKRKILGFKIPFWNEIVKLVKEAAMIVPEVRSVGWDVAVLENGPVLIEGNSKWNKDTWQIPAGFGKRHLIEEYL